MAAPLLPRTYIYNFQLLTVFLLSFLIIDTHAQAVQTGQAGVDISLYQDLQFRTVGPMRAGRVTAVSGVAEAPNVYYMGGAMASGVWRTDDFGHSWRNLTDGQGFKCEGIGSIEVAPSDSSVIYVGTGSRAIRDNVLTGCGMYKSEDSGNTWQAVGLEDAGQIGNLKVDPTNPNRVFAAAMGHAFGKNEQRGVFRSLDGGATWENVLFASDSTGAVDVEIHPENHDIIFAAMWHGVRKPWDIVSGGTEHDGIYKSTDGGDTWAKLANGLPQGLVGKIDVSLTAANPNRVYALIEADNNQTGLYRSEDLGEHWSFINGDRQLMNRPFYFTYVNADPNNADVIYVENVADWKSTDGGETFERVPVTHADVHARWINPNNSNYQVQGNDGGATVTMDGGKSWSTTYNQPTAEFWNLNVDNAFPYRLYAGQQDHSSMVVPSLPSNNTNPIGAMVEWEAVGGCESGPSVPSPLDSDIVYSNCKGRFGIFNRKTGQEQSYYIGAVSMYGSEPAELPYRFARSAPIEVSKTNPKTIYMGSQYVHRSDNGGVTWQVISPDLSANKPQYQYTPGNPITRDVVGSENFSVLMEIATSPLNDGEIWAGAYDGPVSLTRDGGASWQTVTPAGAPEHSTVNHIEVSAHKSGRAYLAILNRMMNDDAPYIYKTEDYGKNWARLTDGNNGIPGDTPTRVVREDPVREGLLYAGTEKGLYISFDDGANWQRFNQGLPNTTITDMKVHQNDLALSTFGRGFWILDDLNVLRQSAQVNPTADYLYTPDNAYRMSYSGGGFGSQTSTGNVGIHRTGVPEYPQPGAHLDFFLADGNNSPVILEIKDSEDQTVQTYVGEISSGDKNAPRGKECTSMLERLSVSANAQCITVKPGHNRLRWDMRYPGRTIASSADNILYGSARGPMILPGTFTITLSRGSRTLTENINVQMDPRVSAIGVTQNDLQAQLELSVKIRDLIGQARSMAAELDSLQSDLKTEIGSGSNSRLRAQQNAAETLHAKLVTNNKINYPPAMFIDQAEYLYRMVSGGHQRPGNEAYTRFSTLLKEFDTLKAAYRKL